ncbi:DUF6343 family protein [Kribbella sp. VKM Ac-2568]|uniref:DUF6343 family protein n=1 Tax=Kribbella sp. VKM Ac-2568 TaxID=2512219 RepID=UPI0010445EC2|nr:DUF6343 family protein [Kribbella sp. VKM Ac-2568]TCM48236.1 hypothetical protein EV648_104632 [Kribbella sp. VKM Ac-2568]
MSQEPPPPRSALTLRIVLASFGLVVCGAAAVLFVVNDVPAGWAIAAEFFAVVAALDLLVIGRRKWVNRQRSRGKSD